MNEITIFIRLVDDVYECSVPSQASFMDIADLLMNHIDKDHVYVYDASIMKAVDPTISLNDLGVQDGMRFLVIA